MKLFEASWQNNWEYYQRYYDTNLSRSIISKVDLKHEWYVPKSTGICTSILDPSIRLDKQSGNSKDGRDQYGFINPIYRNIRDNYWNKDSYNKMPRVWFLDIETRVGTCSHGFPVPDKALEPISMFQFYDTEAKILFLLGTREWVHQSSYKFDYEVRYIKCKDEIDLINTYFAIFKKLDPLIIHAWNGDGFDYPYIHNRLKNLGMDTNIMSNHGDVKYKENEFKGMKEFSVNADGHFYMDLKRIYEKFTFAPRPSYSLDNIAEIELGQRKVPHPEYAAFDDFYTGKYIIPPEPNERQLNSEIYKQAVAGNWDEVKELSHSEFVYYGAIDTNLIREIDNKGNFTALVLMIAEKMGVQPSDALGTVKPWSQYIANKALLNNKVIPPRKDNGSPNVVGGYVRDVEKGRHEWALSEDVNSMYPLLGMVGFNMSPETFIPKHELPPELRDIVLTYFNNQDEEERLNLDDEVWENVTSTLNKHNMALGINGAVFKKDELGMIPEMVQEIYDTRSQAKKTMFLYEQRKILIKEIISER